MKFKPYKCQHKFVADEHLFESVTNDTHTQAPSCSSDMLEENKGPIIFVPIFFLLISPQVYISGGCPVKRD